MSVDPALVLGISVGLVETVNPYMYCGNNPIKTTDPSGMREIKEDPHEKLNDSDRKAQRDHDSGEKKRQGDKERADRDQRDKKNEAKAISAKTNNPKTAGKIPGTKIDFEATLTYNKTVNKVESNIVTENVDQSTLKIEINTKTASTNTDGDVDIQKTKNDPNSNNTITILSKGYNFTASESEYTITTEDGFSVSGSLVLKNP